MIEEFASDRVIGPLAAAAISALVAILLWLANRAWERRAAERVRHERIRDIQQALRAEIRAHIDQLRDSDLDGHWQFMRARILNETGERFVPIVPRETHDTIFSAMIGDLALLPPRVVEPVVLYYAQITSIANLAEDMRGERFADIAPDRMAAMYGHFIEMKKTALGMGAEAYAALTEAVETPPPGSIARQWTRAALDRGYRALGLRH